MTPSHTQQAIEPTRAGPFPRLGGSFWLFHLLGWGAFAGVNLILRVTRGVESLQHASLSLGVLLLVNTLLCLVYRQVIHWLKLRYGGGPLFWAGVFLVGLVLGFVSAVGILSLIGLYYQLSGLSSTFIFFMVEVLGNWMIMSLLLLVWGMTYSLVCVYRELHQAALAQQALSLQLREAQLNVLSGQLNPHFLFNGLNNIRSLMREDVERARDMITALSSILRQALLSQREALHSLQAELEVVHDFIALATLQYEQRLDYREQIDVDAEAVQLPPMLIQLLIENAIRHGIDRSSAGGVLSLHVWNTEEAMMIEVRNPMPDHAAPARSERSTGLGLANIRKRLTLLYGDQARCELNEATDTGQVRVRVNLPHTDTSPA